jgi:hypothetical protein
MSDAIVVLGGYGAVGRHVVGTLARWGLGPLVVGGRNPAPAEALAASLPVEPGTARAQQVDVTDPVAVRGSLQGARVAVMCVERSNRAVAEACVDLGVHLVEVSATTAILRSIEQLHPAAVARGVTAALSVGLAPGVTNLLAHHAHDRLPTATRIDLALAFGLGGDHGAGSRRWILDGLAVAPGRRPIRAAGRPVRAARVTLPGLGTRTAHPFPFSDQDTLTEALGIPVTSRLTFDNAPATAAIFALRRARAFRLLELIGATRWLDAGLSRFHLGSDRFVLQATAHDDQGNEASATVTGHGECRATGVVAAHVARLLHQGSAPAGVHHIDTLVDPVPFLAHLAAEGEPGLTFRRTGVRRTARRGPPAVGLSEGRR